MIKADKKLSQYSLWPITLWVNCFSGKNLILSKALIRINPWQMPFLG